MGAADMQFSLAHFEDFNALAEMGERFVYPLLNCMRNMRSGRVIHQTSFMQYARDQRR
jgi:hypothetical protein